MRLATISSNGTCWQCGGSGIKNETIHESGKRTIVLTVCGCVIVRHVKPKTFVEEVAKLTGKKRRSK